MTLTFIFMCTTVRKANARESEWTFQVPVKHKDLEFLIKRFAAPLTAVLLAVSPICNPPGNTNKEV